MTHPALTGRPGLARPGDWTADRTACSVTFSVRNFGLRTVTGQIPLLRAVVHVDAGGRPVSIRAELDAAGLGTGNRRRDLDLRGRRFLATDRWPVIRFEAKDIEPNGTVFAVSGTLTVQETNCPVRLDVAVPVIPAGAPADHLDLHATAHLDRRSAGVTAAPAFLVGHEVTLSLAIRLRPPAPG